MSNVADLLLTRRHVLRHCCAGSLALAASSLLAACGGSGTTTSAASSAPVTAATIASSQAEVGTSSSGAVTSPATIAETTPVRVAGAVQLVFSTWGAGGSAYSAEHKVVDAFNQVHTAIRAQVLEIPFGSYRDKLLAELAGGDAPDNMAIDHGMFPFMVQKDVFARLDPFVGRDKTVLDDYFPSALQGMSYKGALYGLPTGGSGYYLFWSPRLFQQAGLPTPNDLMALGTWTWQAFLDAAQKLTQGSGTPAAQFGVDAGLNLSAIAPWVWSNGGSYLSGDQQQVRLDQPAAVDAIQFLHDLIWKEHVTPPPGTAPGPIKSFIAGKLAMNLTWGGTGIAQFAPVKDLSWDVALPPAQDGKSFVTWAPLNPMTINKQAKHPDQSWTFERWYNGTPGMQVFSQNGRVPVARSVLTSPAYLKATPPAHKQVVLQGMQVGKPAFVNPNWTLASEQLTPFLTRIAKNTMPVADAMKQAVALANPILAGEELMPLSQLVGINLFGRLDPLDGMRRIASAGYDAIDYSAIGRHATAGTPLASALRVLTSELRLAPAALHYRSFGFDFLGSPEARLRFRSTSLEDVALTADLGAPTIAFHLGNDLPGASDEQLAEANSEALAPAAALAGDLGVAIALENHCHGWGDQFAHLALVAGALDAAQVGFCCDSGHAAVAGVDPASLIAAMGPRLRLIHLHSNDGRRDIHRPAAEGVVRWQPLLAALEQADYAGPLLLEGGLHLPGDNVDTLLTAHLRDFRAALATYSC